MGFAGKLADKLTDFRKKTVRKLSVLFSESITLHTANRIREAFCALSLNVCGMFFLTFGIYSVAASILLHFFESSFAGNVSVFSGAVMIVSSIPMLFSKDNISNALYYSRVGYAICDAIDVRMVTLRRKNNTGHLNQGFALGVVAGTLAIALSVKTILMVILLVTVCTVSFALPATGIVFVAIALPFFSDGVFTAVCLFTLLAYFIKTIRGKRSNSLLHLPGILFTVFSLYMTFRTVLGPASLSFDAWKFVIFLIPYFLCSHILKNFNDAVKVPIIISLSCAAAAILYCLAYGIDVLTEVLLPSSGINGGILFGDIRSLPVFSAGTASLMITAAIPVSAVTALRSDHRLPRAVLWLCALADFLYLLLCGSLSLMCIAALVLTVAVLIYGRKWGYFSLIAIYVAAAAFVFAGGVTDTVTDYFSDTAVGIFDRASHFLRTFFSLPTDQILFGSGDVRLLQGANFYSRFLLSYGAMGLALLFAFIIAVSILSISAFIKTSGTDKKQDLFDRFGAVRSSADTRLGIAVPLAGAFTILLGGLFTNVFGNTSVYITMFMYFGIWFAYTRTAQKEITKAISACSFSSNATAAEIQIKL